jgi:23S rRNA (cytosine1962-C5)-methyltransferase
MSKFLQVVLKPGREQSLRRFHLWIFSGAIEKISGIPKEGDVVEVVDHKGNYLATGHIQNGSIAVRIFSFVKTSAGRSFWYQKLEAILKFRRELGFFNNLQTTLFRLVHGEGDGCPGLIVDYYNGVVVLQAHSVGMWLLRKLFAEIFDELLKKKPIIVYDKSYSSLNEAGDEASDGFLIGRCDSVIVKENGNQFLVDFEKGQKTGFYIDQRENRLLLSRYAGGRKVANIFAYTGGFSVYAAAAGATMVDSIDASQPAIDMARQNMQLNFGEKSEHRFITSDAFSFLKNTPEKYDLIVLDPPAFAKHRQALGNALKAYRRINREAIMKINENGILFTFSCSQVVTKDDFKKVVFSAAAEAGRNVRILHQLTQPPDHPVNIYHPEGEYLKGLVLFVE